MGWSPLSTEVHNTSQYSARTRPPAGVVLHHGATTSADAIIQMETTGSRQVSSHQVVKDRRNAGIVQEQFRAWSLSDAYWDSWAFTVECANESTNGWTISNESHETLAQLVANWAQRYGFWPHRSGDPRYWTVYGHREIYTIHGGSYATACPGGMNLDWITAQAQDILTGKTSTPRSENPMLIFKAPNKASSDGVIAANGQYAQRDDGILRPMSDEEFGVWNFFTNSDQANPKVPAIIVTTWDSERIRNHSKRTGIMEWTGTASSPNVTGRIIYADKSKAAYPAVSASVDQAVIQAAIREAVASIDFATKADIASVNRNIDDQPTTFKVTPA